MVSYDLTGKVAIVTGGSGGLGLDMTRGLVQAGADVAIIARNPEKMAKAKAELEALVTDRKVKVECYSCDLLDVDSMTETVKKIIADFGKVNILLNNAGAITFAKGAENITEADWDKVVDTDVKSVFLLSQTVFKLYFKEHGGNIVNIGSVSGLRSSSDCLPYSVAKAAVLTLTKCLGFAWAKYGVFVNAVSPGQMSLGMAETMPQDKKDEMARTVPQKRLGTNEDLTGAVIFFASDACRYCQGQNVVCDGGLLLPLVNA